MDHSRAGRTAAVLCALVAATAAGAGATSLPNRTARISVSPTGDPADGESADPALSSDGRVITFDTSADNIAPGDANRSQRDVVTYDLASGARRLVSVSIDGNGGDGPSYGPSVTGSGQDVAFVSEASNLVAGDTNRLADVFYRAGGGAMVDVSVAPDGRPGNGPSSQADISADGRYVAFSSTASNLVPGDDNGQSDVFVRDLSTGKTTLVSVGMDGRAGDGFSATPAISADGHFVSFSSAANDLVPGDTNDLSDVFVRDLVAHRTERVSVSTRGAQQNKSVIPPFTQISDVSSDGRYVVFDSDSTDLTPRDLNRHTDIFLRDRQKRTTTLVSASSVNVEGDNDSFAPTLTPNGRYLAFESFASNLAPHDPPREDVFVRDLRQGTTSLLDVASDGSPRGPELVKQLLQRVALSANARIAAFASTAANLSPEDSNGLRDLFVRVLDPPRGRVTRTAGAAARRPVVTLSADDPTADDFVCRVDVGAPFRCSAGPVRLPLLPTGRHRFSARAGGPGMLFDPKPAATTVVVDRTGPRVRIAPLGSGRPRAVRGTAHDDLSGVAKVEVAMVAVVGRNRCTEYNGRRVLVDACRGTRIYVPAHGTRHWSLALPTGLVPGGKPALVAIYARARDGAGNLGHVVRRLKIVR